MNVAYPYIYPTHLPARWHKGHYEGIVYFHGHLGSDYHDLLGHYRRLKEYLPDNMLPIADSGRLCLKLAGEHAGAVYQIEASVMKFRFCPIYDEVPIPLQEEAQTKVASSFDEFIRSLRVGVRGKVF